MNTFHDYESMGCVNFNQEGPALLEAFSGTAVVQWYGNIERQLGRLLGDAEKGRNYPYADKLRTFQKIWRDNEITGSMNRETLDVLKSSADVLGVDNWNLSNYFSNLRDQLRKLVASEEELPRDLDMNANDPMRGMGGGGRGAPPMSNDFGPEDKPPGEEDKPEDLEAPPLEGDQQPGDQPPGEPGADGAPGGNPNGLPDDDELPRA